MFRTLTISLLSVAAVATLNAGQIQLGGTNGLITSVSGTTINGYLNNGCAGTGAYTPVAFSGCVPVSATTNTAVPATIANASTNAAWVNRVFGNALLGTPTLTTPVTSPITSIPAPATQITANGVTFDTSAIAGSSAEGIADFGFNSTGSQVAGLYTLTVPVGIYDVDQVWTMLQDFWGTAAANTTSVEFEFGSKSDGSGTNVFDTVTLTQGGQIRSSVQCGGGPSGCPLAANGDPFLTTLDTTSHTGQGTQGDVTLSAANVYLAPYTGMGSGTFAGTTSGNVVLDDQSFKFGNAYANDYLVSITIENQMTPSQSKDFLSAVTVDQVTPEPSSILLFLAGFGAIGATKLRRRNS
jgi:hypothetical protein